MGETGGARGVSLRDGEGSIGQAVLGGGPAGLSAAFILAFIRLWIGPTIVDRILALELISGVSFTLIVLITLDTGQSVYLNLAFALAVLSFLSTTALARYLRLRN